MDMPSFLQRYVLSTFDVFHLLGVFSSDVQRVSSLLSVSLLLSKNVASDSSLLKSSYCLKT